MSRMQEKSTWTVNGFLVLLVDVALLGLTIGRLVSLGEHPDMGFPGPFWNAMILMVLATLIMPGFFVINPNEARTLVFFGKYVGTVREAGFFWSNPFAIRKPITLRIRNFHSDRLKVNDAHGNPVEIAAVVVWRVVDTARALFEVEGYERFVAIQTETAIRTLAQHYPYDDEHSLSLRANPDEIATALCKQVQDRLQAAGVEVIEARISHLAYAPEVAQAMLRRQQAQAIIAARQRIVEGAVSMVQGALRMLREQGVVELDEDKKATMVNNMLVALISEREAQPVINTGTLHQ